MMSGGHGGHGGHGGNGISRRNGGTERHSLRVIASFALFLCFSVVSPFSPSPLFSQSAQSEIPRTFKPVADTFDYVRRDEMIPMRDGVRLHTVILVPKGAKNAPILLTRTPYSATGLTTHADSAHLAPILQGYDNAVDVIVEGG